MDGRLGQSRKIRRPSILASWSETKAGEAIDGRVVRQAWTREQIAVHETNSKEIGYCSVKSHLYDRPVSSQEKKTFAKCIFMSFAIVIVKRIVRQILGIREKDTARLKQSNVVKLENILCVIPFK